MGISLSTRDDAHNAGLSPSSTQDSNSKAGGDAEIQAGSDSEKEKKTSVSQEKLPEEPESNDTSYGVEATAVRTLAATTGTVAILGTTAKTGELSKSQTNLAEDTEEINISVDQEKNNEENKNSENSNKDGTNLNKSEINKREVSNVNITNDSKESRTPSGLIDSETENSNKLVSNSKNDSIVNHITAEVDNSTSLENSVDNHSETVPDNKKAINYKPSKQTTTALVENVNDESEHNVLVNGEINNLSTDKDDVCSSEDNIDEDEERPETVVEVEKLNKTESECKSRNSVSENSGSDDTKGINDDISSEQLKTNSLSNTTLSESFNAELDSVKQSPEPREETLTTEKSRETIISVGLNEDDNNDAIVIENPMFIQNENQSKVNINDEKQKSEEITEEIKIDNVEPTSKVQNGEVNNKIDTSKSPINKELEKSDNSKESIKNDIRQEEVKIQEVTKPKTPESKDKIDQNVESVVTEKEEPKLSKEKTEDEEKLTAAATTIQSSFRGYQVRQNIQKKDDVESGENKSKEYSEDTISKEPSKSKEESVVDDEEKEKLENAATTIQATFRGYQTRQNIQKIEASESEVEEKTNDMKEETKSITNDLDKEKLESAATTIQATFRGYQTRQNMPKKEVDEIFNEGKSNIAKDEIIPIDNDKEKLEQAATTIQATFRGYQMRQNIGKDQSPSKGSFESVKEEIQPVMSISIKEKTEKDNELPTVVTEEKNEDKEIIKNLEKSNIDENTDTIPQNGDKLEFAATKIQSNFRGYQVRKNLNKEDISNEKENSDNFSNEDVKLASAATTIQAHFRGFQTRQKLSENMDGKTEPPISLTPEVIESVKEEVDEICKQAEETTENMIKSGTDILFRAKLESSSKSENEEIQEIETQDSDESITKTASKTVQSIVNEAEQIADQRMNSAATRIQASFRGFQVRKNFDKAEEPDSIPDFPPSTDEDYLFGTPVLDDDLPPPDFEALESSYSEDVATEPLDVPPPMENLPIPESEEVSEASTEVNDDDLRHLQRPQECDELKKSQDMETSSEGESSLSSAATKIQAGIRGYLTRKHIHNVQGGTGTTSTSAPSVASSDQSLGDLSSSKEEEGPVRSMISTEEETEIGKHRSTPEKLHPKPTALDSKLSKKRMSLDSRLVVYPPSKNARPLRAMSVSSPRDDVSNEEIWQTLQHELTSAATRIQSNYRGYRARKQLTRGDAVQMATTSSSATGTTTPNSVDSSISHPVGVVDRTSGEYHDMIALTPPSNMTTVGEEEEEEELEEGARNDQKREEGITKPAGEMTAPASSKDESRMVKRQHTDTDVDEDNKSNIGEEEKAATKIQAHYKGYKVRKSLKDENDSSPTEGVSDKLSNMKNQPSETNESKPESTRNSSDIENEAAKKIQAGFRGMKTRQELKQKQQNSSK